MDAIQLNRVLERAKLTLARQEATLKGTLELISAIGTTSKLTQQRNRQHTAVQDTKDLIANVEKALAKGPRKA